MLAILADCYIKCIVNSNKCSRFDINTGFCIEGFDNFGPSADNFQVSAIKHLIKDMVVSKLMLTLASIRILVLDLTTRLEIVTDF